MSNTRGLVIGKFLPLTCDDIYLIDFALNYVEELTVFVSSQEIGAISGLEELFPGKCKMVGARTSLTEGRLPSQTEYVDSGLSQLKGHDYIFCAQDYGGWDLCTLLGGGFVPVDHPAPLPALPLVKERILKQQITVLKRICIFCPESTGKSTLARNLAAHFKTVWVPEYAREYIGSRNNQVALADIPSYARGQIASEDALARQADRLLICDSDAITTCIWSDWLFGSCPAETKILAEQRQYDLYLLTDVDVPWVADPQRYAPTERERFRDLCISELQSRGRPYVTIKGDWTQRFGDAVKAVDILLAQLPHRI